MYLRNDEFLLKNIIKKNNIIELKKYLTFDLKSENFNDFKEILLYFIENNASFSLIEYIINHGQIKNLNFYVTINNIKKVPLFIAISNNNFKLSNLLIKYNADINYMVYNQNIIDYLLRYNLLITDINLKYILSKFDRNNISKNLIYKLIEKKQNDILETILCFYKKINTNFILNTFLIRIYRNRIPLSDKELEYTIDMAKRDIPITEEMYSKAFFYNNIIALRILLENDSSKENEILDRIVKYNILEISIQTKNYNFVQKVLNFKPYYYKYEYYTNETIVELTLSEAINNIIPKAINKSKKITKLLIKTLLNESEKYKNIKNRMSKNLGENMNRKYDIRYLNYILNMMIKMDKSKFIKYLIKSSDFKLTPNDITGKYPIITSLYYNNIKTFKYLIKHGANINIKNNDRCSLLSLAINNNPYFVKYLLRKPNINVHIKDKWGTFPILDAIKQNNFIILESLFNYCYKNKISFNINEKDSCGVYPFLAAVYQNNDNILRTIIDYCKENDIILDISGKSNDGIYPLQLAIYNNNTYLVKFIIDYAHLHNINLLINEKDSSYFIIKSIYNDNIYILKLLFDYFIENGLKININESDKYGRSPILIAINQNNSQIVDLLIDYANNNDIILEINPKNNEKTYPLLEATYSNNPKIIKQLMKYANDHGIVLQINEKDYNNIYPLLEAVHQNNNIIVEELMNYADNHKIYLELNEKDNSKMYPL